MLMSSVRVCTIAFDWYPFHARVRGLAEAAIDGGYSVDVICLRQPHEKRYEVYQGVHIYRMPIKRNFGGSVPTTVMRWCWFLLVAGIVLTWLHLKHPYDVIHVHNLPDFLVFAALFPKLRGAKVILDVQDPSPELMTEKVKGRLSGLVKWLAIWQERLSMAFADHVFTVFWIGEELFVKRGVPREKVTSIVNSANPKFFPAVRRAPPPSEAAQESSPFILMYHGTVAERQGLDTIIRALPLVRRVVPQVRLDIKGGGEYVLTLKRLAADLGVSEHVVFSELCPIGEVVDFVLHGDVGIIPYRAGGFMEIVLPVKAFEFAWMHRPMIASDTYGMRLLFRPESVMFCDPAQPESFAEAIICLYQHPEKRAALVANAAEDYLQYRWELQVERYHQVLASLSYKQLSKQYPVAQSEL